MTDNRDADLMYLLGACGSALHDELKKLSGDRLIPKNVMRAHHAWAHPAMVVRTELLGYSLTQIPNLMFGHLVDHIQIDPTWMRCMGVLCNKSSELAPLVNEIFPGLPLNGMKPVNIMARVLALLAAKGGKLSFPPGQMILTHEGLRYGVTSLAVIAPEGGKRLRRRGYLDCWTAFNVVGTPIEGDIRLVDLEAQVVTWMPKLQAALQTLIGAAVHRGQRFVEQLLDCFEFAEVEKESTPVDVWSKASSIVRLSDKNPLSDLHDLLKEVVPSQVFMKMFGNPYTGSERHYTLRQRQKHREAIAALRGKVSVPSANVNSEHAAAEALLNFQRQMGL